MDAAVGTAVIAGGLAICAAGVALGDRIQNAIERGEDAPWVIIVLSVAMVVGLCVWAVIA